MKPAEGPAQLTLWVDGAPATFATAGERPWREAVSAAAIVAMGAREPFAGRLRVEIRFQMPPRGVGHPGWDLDNLIKPTIDALTPVIGMRPGKWQHLQPDDERIDEILASKTTVGAGGPTGAHITVAVLAQLGQDAGWEDR